MKKFMIFSAVCTLFFFLLPHESQTCTTFCFDHDDRLVCGKNYDWMFNDGLVIINKRGVTKTAISPAPATPQTSKPFKWTSKYGSITFNQYGREMPTDGMNEAGLVVEALLLDETQYPPPDSRPALIAMQWKQYQLDNFSTVEEVIASNLHIRVQPVQSPGIHIFVCDRTGNSAVIEFIEGKVVIHTRKKMPVKTLTDSSAYATSIDFWKKDKLPPFDKEQSVKRFIRAANMIKTYDSKTSAPIVNYAFEILKSTRRPSTQWSKVYDIKNLRIYFRTNANPKTRHMDMKKLDFSCQTPVRVLDINGEMSGDVTNNFQDYTPLINRSLVRNAFEKTFFLIGTPEKELDGISQYPDSTRCQ